MLYFDLETDGLLDEVTTVHVLCTLDSDTGEHRVYRKNSREDTIREGLDYLRAYAAAGGMLAAQNGIGFDLPVLKKLYGFEVPESCVRDTLILAQMLFSDIEASDFLRHKKGTLPGNLIGSHKLEAWGYRLNVLKGEYAGDPTIEDPKERHKRRWESWNQSMEDYCVQDVVVTKRLGDLIEDRKAPAQAIEIEHRLAFILRTAEKSGYWFDEAAAAKLYAELSGAREAIRQELVANFGTWKVRGPDFIPKRDNVKLGYKAGVPVERWTEVTFSPSSRQHIAKVLQDLGWKPQEFTAGGQPTVDDEILSELPYPEARQIAEYLLLEKRIGQLAEGNGAWLKKSKNGIIHPRINGNGTVTGRATHSNPNIAQVPKVGTKYGAECRALFGPPPDWYQVGCDMSGLELRCLGHFMGRYDGGAYGDVVVNGDVHSLNCEAIGLSPKETYTVNGRSTTGRNLAKTWIYALLYGAGDEKLGSITDQGKAAGKKQKAAFAKALPALKQLQEAVGQAAKRGYINGIDGRVIRIRHAHAALNTLLQSAGALLCKYWLCNTFERIAQEFTYGRDFVFLTFVHDETAWGARTKEIAERIAAINVEECTNVGVQFNWRCPLAGEAKIGRNWMETH